MILIKGGSVAATVNPSFVVGVAGTTDSLTLAGIQTDDLVVAIACGNSQFLTTPIGWTCEVSGAPFVAGAFISVYTRTVRPQDTTTLTLSSDNAGAFAMAAFRHVFPIDGLATLKNATSALPVSNSFANLVAGDFAVNFIGWDVVSGNSDYTVSTGYTLACHQQAVGGSHFGAGIEYKQLGAAGTVVASSGAALGQSGDWGVFGLALHP